VPKLSEMHALLATEQSRKHANMLAFRDEYGSPSWSLPEATRALGDPSALADWIELGRPVEGIG